MRKLSIVLLLLSGMAVAQSSHGVDLSWNPSVDAQAGLGYNVYRSLTSGSGYIKLNLAPVIGLAFPDNNLSIGQSYFYVVRSSFNNMESINSNEAKAVILPAPPTQVTATQR